MAVGFQAELHGEIMAITIITAITILTMAQGSVSVSGFYLTDIIHSIGVGTRIITATVSFTSTTIVSIQ